MEGRKTIGRFGAALSRAATLIRRSGPIPPAVALGLSVASGLLVGLELIVVREVVDRILEGQATTWLLVAFGASAATRRLLAGVANELQWLVAERVERSVLREILATASAVRFERFEQPEFQNRLQRALAAGRTDVWAIAWGLQRFATACLTIATLSIVLLTVAPDLILPFTFVACALAAVAIIKGRLVYRLEFDDTEPDRERAYLRDALVSRSEGKEIRLFGTRERLHRRHDDLFAQRISGVNSVIRKRVAADLVSNFVLAAVVVGCLVLVANRTTNGELGFGDAAAAALTANQLANSLNALLQGASRLVESTLRIGDLESFSDEKPEPQPIISGHDLEAIGLERASYRYPDSDKTAVDDVSIRVNRGELVALVGENGSGKSTIAKMVTGLYPPSSGAVYLVENGRSAIIDGSLGGTVGSVFQDFARYEMTLRENITLGSAEGSTDDDGIVEALRAVGLSPLLEELSAGLETRLGRRFDQGVDLSLGQWQRLAIARALFSQTPFVVLDEPSASLDPKIEHALFDELRELMPGRGILLIAQRFTSVMAADRIVVINEGRIAEQGTHDELMSLDGHYASLFRIQARRYVKS